MEGYFTVSIETNREISKEFNVQGIDSHLIGFLDVIISLMVVRIYNVT